MLGHLSVIIGYHNIIIININALYLAEIYCLINLNQ